MSRRAVSILSVAVGLLAAAPPPPAGAAAQGLSQQHCLLTLQRGFESVAAAQRREVEACVADAVRGRLGGLDADACLAADRRGLVAAAKERALAAERASCSKPGTQPDFGAAGAAAANAAATAAGIDLAAGLFGLDLDAALATRSANPPGARCQEALLGQAGRCSARFAAEYGRCARGALRGGADGPFDLVACKGADPAGVVAEACEAELAAVLSDATACVAPGVAPTALFPGCAGDLAACARGHARRTASLALNAAGALCGDLLPGELAEPVLLQCFEPPPREPVEYADVPVPDGVRPNLGIGSSRWEPDGHLVFPFSADGLTGNHLARMRLDGGDFRCLTCAAGLPGNVRPVDLFADGRRVLYAGGNSPTPRWRVLECTPSLLDCPVAELLPIELPPNPDPANGVLQYRVPHVSADDGWFVWTEVRLRGPGNFLSAMGRLVREPDRYVVSDARVIAPPLRSLDLGTDSDLWRLFTANYEAKEAELRGGLDLVVAATPEAGHYDDLAIELATGDVRRLTRHPDHDEGLAASPDEAWHVFASSRLNPRVEHLGLLPRPPYIDGIAFSIHFVGVAGAPGDGISPGSSPIERDCYLEPWLVDRWGERGSYLGQELLAPGADGYEPSPGVVWSPDGRAVALVEQRWKRLVAPGEEQASRLRIARLVTRRAVDPAAVAPAVATPEPTWAIRYEDYVIPDTSGATVIPGKVSGTATLVNDLPVVVSGEIAVEYEGYSDDGLHVLDGFERMTIPLLISGATYDVDLTLSGARSGFSRGSVQYDFDADVNTGVVETELDGRRLAGPRTCEEAGLLPPLAP
jgi:hypothetical protein